MSRAGAVALDTSTAVALVMRTHPAHSRVRAAVGARTAVLTSHSLAETYSVLTRLVGDARVAPADAARLINHEFGEPALLSEMRASSLADDLSARGIAGGAVYDALVGLAAEENDLALLTTDRRALGTYAAVGVTVELVS